MHNNDFLHKATLAILLIVNLLVLLKIFGILDLPAVHTGVLIISACIINFAAVIFKKRSMQGQIPQSSVSNSATTSTKHNSNRK